MTSSNVGPSVSLGIWGFRPVLSHSQPVMAWFYRTHWPRTSSCPPSPTVLPFSPHTPGTWPGSCPTLGLLGILPGGWPPRSRSSAPIERFCGRNWVFLCAVTTISHPSETLGDLYGEYGLVYSWGNYLSSSSRSLNELIL